MKKILIVGATGRIASIVADYLYAIPNVSLRLSSTRKCAVEALQKKYPNANCINANWYDVESLSAAFKGVEQVVIIPPDFVIDEYQVVPNLVEAYTQSGTVKQIIRLIATPKGVTPDMLNQEYLDMKAGGALHTLGKYLLDKTELPLTYVNMLAWFTSNLPWFFAEDIKQHNKIRLPGADVPRAWLTEEDMAQCFVNLLMDDMDKHIGQEYVLMSQERYTFKDIATILSRELEREIVYQNTDAGLKDAGQDILARYIQYESEIMGTIEITYQDDINKLLAREPERLKDWIHQHRNLFL